MNSHLLLRLNGFAEAIVDRFEKWKTWFLAGFSIMYLSVTCILASRKLLWNDELYTYYISRLPSLTDVWAALSTGAEQIPPLFYVITRASLALFGTNNLTIRLPEVIGFWVMSLCLFRFVSKRSPAFFGFLAMLFPLFTNAYNYAYEARPYGLVLGFSGLAMLSWQSATERVNRQISLIGLALSLAAAVSCHYYAVLIFIPLALAEAVRSYYLRRLDFPIWAALMLGATPLLGFLTLLQRAMVYSSAFWSKTQWMSIPEFYYVLLAPAVLPLTILLALSSIFPATINTLRQNDKYPPHPYLHEMAAALGLMAIPIIAVTLSMVITGAFTDRYALQAVIGVSIVVAYGVRQLLGNRPVVAAILMLFLCVSFLSLGIKSFTKIGEARKAQTQTVDFLRSVGTSDLPIAVTDQHEFINLAHNAPPDIASRLVYLADPGKALYYLGHNSVEKGVVDLLKPWFHLPIEEYDRYIASRKEFLVYGSASHFLNWMLSDLTGNRRLIELKGRNGDSLLFLVSHDSRPENTTFDSSATEERLRTGWLGDHQRGQTQR
ncbi:MAG: glycosyltransferase family 39 protein [Acidobacteria bacterium]|nr:glycosyltransferase family 39 protein [Acidobacteriota bacterium]